MMPFQIQNTRWLDHQMLCAVPRVWQGSVAGHSDSHIPLPDPFLSPARPFPAFIHPFSFPSSLSALIVFVHAVVYHPTTPHPKVLQQELLQGIYHLEEELLGLHAHQEGKLVAGRLQAK